MSSAGWGGRGLRGAVGVAVGLAAGCSGTRTAPGPPSVPLRSPTELAGDFQWRQEVTVTWQGSPPRAFDAVLAKSGDRLRLVGLTPIDTVLFVAEQVGGEVSFENRTGEPLPFDASFILRDVQRAFFPWLSGPVEAGRRSGVCDGVRVVERFDEGRVVERVFERADRPPVRVRFHPTEAPAPRVTIEDEALDYRLEIITHS